MSITLETLNQLANIIKENDLQNKRVISIGDHYPGFVKIPSSLYRLWGIKPENVLSRAEGKSGARDYLRSLVIQLGYEDLVFSDNTNDATLTYQLDLSKKDSWMEVNQKFGVVIDNGTSIYAFNILNALNNVSQLVDENGYLLTNIDPMSFNRFPFLPAPESLVEFMLVRKMICTNLDLVFSSPFKLAKRRAYPINYRLKHYHIFSCLTKNELINYVFFIIKTRLRTGKIESDFTVRDYLLEKQSNYSSLTARLQKSAPTKIGKYQRKVRHLFNYLRQYRYLKDAFHVARKIIHDPDRGRVYIDMIFVKDDRLPEVNLNSSTLHYELRWRESPESEDSKIE